MKTRLGFIICAALLLLVTVAASKINRLASPRLTVSGISVTDSSSSTFAPSEPARLLDSISAFASASLAPNTVFVPADLEEEMRAIKEDRYLPVPPTIPRQPFARSDLFVYRPTNIVPGKPLRVLVVLHGMGNRGDVFSRNLIADAESHGWLLIAPTMRYGDWMNPDQVIKDDLLFTRMLLDTLDTLPAELGVKVRKHVLILGFSRGAQLAQRFAFFYPERVATVATISGGAYTLPQESRSETSGTRVLTLPFGVGDVQKHLGKPVNWGEFRKITFWVAVGANDNHKDDVPRNYDAYVGDNRLARAQNLYNSLCSVGVDAHIAVFPNTGHEMTTDIRREAVKFLRDDEVADKLDD